MRSLIVTLTLTAAALAGDDPYLGTFSDGKTTLRLSATREGYVGSLTLGGKKVQLTASRFGEELTGELTAAEGPVSFRVSMEGAHLVLWLDGERLELARSGAALPAKPGAAGDWRSVGRGERGGEAFVRVIGGAQSVRALLTPCRESLRGIFDATPQIHGGVIDREDTTCEVVLSGLRTGRGATGLLVIRVLDGKALCSLVCDSAEGFAASLPGLLQVLGQGTVVPRWGDAMFPDGSGSMRLPAGWVVDSAREGAVDAHGPAGEVLTLGAAFTVVTPEGNRGMLGPLDCPLVGYPREPADSFREVVPQVMRFVRATNPNQPITEITGVLESAPTPWRNSKAAFLLYEARMHGGAHAGPYRGIALVVVSPISEVSWQFYLSAVAAPTPVFDRSLPTLLEAWGSWRISDDLIMKRWKAAVESMNKVTEIIQSVTLNQAGAAAKAHDAWCVYISDVGTVTDPRTGDRQAVSANNMKNALDQMNQTAGYQKWHAIPPGG